MAGIDAPESRTRDLEEKARGKAATAFVEQLLAAQSQPLIVRTAKDDKGKFGRYLADVVLTCDEHGEPLTITAQVEPVAVMLSTYMIQRGHAVAYDGGAR